MPFPAELRHGEPMLAQAARADGDLDQLAATLTERGWWFDIKWDGIRALALVDGDDVRLRSRNGEDLTNCYPEVASLLRDARLPEPVVLDGELVCFDGARPSFERTHRRAMQRDARRAARLAVADPATFILFDLPWSNQDLRCQPWAARHRHLTELADAHQFVVSPVAPDGAVLLRAAREQRLEGLVAKRPKSPYRHGHSPDWLKLKFTHSVSALVTAITAGTGARAATFGALVLELRESDDTPRAVGKVGSGFSAADLREITKRLATGTPVIVEVTYQGLTSAGNLRFPRFTGLRADLGPDACTAAQLDG